nr:protein kinase-like domain, phloem protein 2-like protein [Tanacetum cinerariifolium]
MLQWKNLEHLKIGLNDIERATENFAHKYCIGSDVYSLGVVLLEVLCGMSAVLLGEKLGEGLLSKLASHLDDIIDQHLKNQMDAESLKIFSETARCCIKEERADRPYIDQVVKRLEKALELQSAYENPELPKNAVDSTSSNHSRNLEHLKIAFTDIELADRLSLNTFKLNENDSGSEVNREKL